MKETKPGEIRIEVEGEVIVVHAEGMPTVELVRHYHQQLVALIKNQGLRKVLYDGLQVIPPSPDVALEVWKLDRQLSDIPLRRAVVIPAATILANLAGLAFSEGAYRLFYSDIRAAMQWLVQPESEADESRLNDGINSRLN
ncbi:MAG TPA: hypothetical protein VL688_03545 [Verrucomicrobiae bacterium]|nr:hypothetical protein [Verrucomicrobiae bacterium]